MMAGKGLEKVDVGALSAEQQEKLRQFKIKTRIDNEKYLRSHPEVEILISDFLSDVILKRPADVREFAADHFTNPNLHVVIGSKMQGNSDME
ncbi:RIIa domain-containing protein 1 [Centroberyx affinis]|uniref:RIIa domain-containing protein 1 n=2 Tax=Centroberyx TaxID=88664 RepID=UPI003A5BB7D8